MNEIYLNTDQMLDLKIALEENFKSPELKEALEGKGVRYFSEGLLSIDGVRIQGLITKKFKNPSYLIKFEQNVYTGDFLRILSIEKINYIKLPQRISRYGKELDFKYFNDRKKNPDEVLPDYLIVEILEIVEDIIKVKFPGENNIYSINNRMSIDFMDRKPTELELRLQEMRLRSKRIIDLNDISGVYPLYYYLGRSAEKVLLSINGKYIKFNIWDLINDIMKGYDVSVDDALIALYSCIYDGGWESGGSPEKDLLHSDYFRRFTDESQTASCENQKELYLIYRVFEEKLIATFRTIEKMKEFNVLKAQDQRNNIVVLK